MKYRIEYEIVDFLFARGNWIADYQDFDSFEEAKIAREEMMQNEYIKNVSKIKEISESDEE